MGINADKRNCILIFGGSFDPVHNGHVALAASLVSVFQPAELRLVPAGQPWQKSGLCASAGQRVEMLKLAFAESSCPVRIDQQEIRRAQSGQASYTIDTLRQIRMECGQEASLIFAMGADQFLNLHTWHHWRELFSLAHLCAAARPGFSLDQVVPEVAQEWQLRTQTAEAICTMPAGGSYLYRDLAVDVSATQLREAFAQGSAATNILVPAKVLDYLKQQAIYEKNGY